MGIFGSRKQTQSTEHLAVNTLIDELQSLPPEAQLAVYELIQKLIPSLSSERDKVEALPWERVIGIFKNFILMIAPKMLSPSKCWQKVSTAWDERLPQVKTWCEMLQRKAEGKEP